jgi:nucleotide-binding universal stress UspA family protein
MAYNKELFDTLKEAGRKILEGAKLLANAQGIQTEAKFLESVAPLEAILANLKDCDLVVMGTRAVLNDGCLAL